MNAIHLYVRGIKIAVSNLELPLVLWAALHVAAILCIVPIAGVAGLAAFSLDGALPAGTSSERLLHLLEWLVDHWLLVGGVNLVLMTWVAAVLFCLLYLEAGVLGVLVKAHRCAPTDELALVPRLGFSRAMRVFRFDDLRAEVKRHGWRVTVLATLYSTAGLVLGALLCTDAAVGILLSLRRPSAIPFAAASFLALVLVTAILFSAITLHYRYALLYAVSNATGAREAMRAATLVFRERPLQVVAIFLLSVGFTLTLGAAGTALSLPLGLLSLIPFVGLGLLLPRLLLSLAEGFVMQALWVSTLGAMLPLCDGLTPASPAVPTAGEAPAAV